jgi:hypothetical protein
MSSKLSIGQFGQQYHASLFWGIWAMSSRLGFYIIEPFRIRGYDQAVVQARPRVIKVMGGPSELGILSYYHDQIGNGTTYIARIWPFEKTIADMLATGQGPTQAADTMFGLLHNFVHAAGMEWCWFECGPNEPSDDDRADWHDRRGDAARWNLPAGNGDVYQQQ